MLYQLKRLAYSGGVIFLFFGSVLAQSLSIPEQLKHAGEPLAHGVEIASGPAPTLREVLSDTDVIVRGTVGESRSYLTDDQREIRTDYSILGVEFLFRRDDLQKIQVPSVPGALTVTLLGGEVTVGGLSYTSIHKALPSLEAGTECVLLLKQIGDKYYVALKYYGAFRTEQNGLIPSTLRRGFAAEYENVPAATAINDIVAQRRKLRR